MAIDINAVACPQCGSTDVEMLSEGEGICKYCRTRFKISQRIDSQNVYNEIHIHDDDAEISKAEDDLCKCNIRSTVSKEEFLREAWITLASEDVPLDVFNENFEEPYEIDHQLFINSISAEVSYRVSVGYDRDEPYIDYEKYYEDVPIQVTEEYYDYATHSKKTRLAVKNQSVKKERPVTRYKKVTDWSMTAGNFNTTSVVAVENLKNRKIDEERLSRSLPPDIKKLRGNIEAPDESTAASMALNDSTSKYAMKKHCGNIEWSLKNSLPGDRYRDLSWEIVKSRSDTSFLCNIKEYEAILKYKGKEYKKRSYAIGKAEVAGDKIINDKKLTTIIKEKNEELEKRKNDRQSLKYRKIEGSTAPLSWVTIGLLALSIILSVFVRVTSIIIIAYVVALAAFLLSLLQVNKVKYKENLLEKWANEKDENQTKKEIDDFKYNYKTKLLETLNDKMRSLNLKEVKIDEIRNDFEYDSFYDEDDYEDFEDYDDLDIK